MIPVPALAFTLLAAGAPPAARGPASVPPCPSGVDKPDVQQLVHRTEQLLQGSSTVATVAMHIVTPSYTRDLKLKMWSKGDDYALIRVLEGGPREKGMMTLKREKQLWNYLPKAGRVMKLPSGMLGDSWMGSDFTNDDLVKGSSLTKDFSSTVAGTVDVAGHKAWKLVLVPKESAAVVWGKVEYLVDRASCLPLSEQFYDEDGKLARKMTLSGFKDVGWRKFPTKMTVSPGEPGHETTLTYEDVAFDVDIPDSTFSVHRLEQGR